MARLGSEVPRIYTPQLRELTPDTTLGFEVIEFAETDLQLKLLPWEKWFFVHALEIVDEPDGGWHLRFRTLILLVARQNGKSLVAAVLALYFSCCLDARLVLGTAQDMDQATEVWEQAVGMMEESDALAAQIEQVYRGNGNKTLRLSGHRRYKVAAATRKGTRGKTSNLVLMDEVREHTNFQAWSAASKTVKAVENGLVFCMSNAGDGASVVLRHLRQRAHAAIGDPDGIVAATGVSEIEPDAEQAEAMEAALSSMGIFEWSATPNCDIWDRDEWAQANPSMGYGFLEESTIAGECATDPENEFRVEDLCQWITASVTPPFPVDAWDAGKDEKSEIDPDSPLWWGVDVSADRLHASIAVCGKRSDGEWHVELAAYRGGTGWLVTWIQDAAPNYGGGMRIAMQSRGAPIASLMDVIAAIDGVTIVECAGKDVAGWAGRMWDAVAACSEDVDSDATPVRHRTQPALDLAANIAATRPMGDGAWAWDRNKSLEDISPLVAATMALGAATQAEVDNPTRYESVYEERGVFVL
jgi:phage terminase large subunit-like protein